MLCCLVAESLTIMFPETIWKVGNVSNEMGDQLEKLLSSCIQGVAWFLLAAGSRMCKDSNV